MYYDLKSNLLSNSLFIFLRKYDVESSLLYELIDYSSLELITIL